MTQPTKNGSASQLAWTTTGSTTLTLAHNHAGGNFLTIDIEAVDGSLRTLSSLTYGGVACTRIAAACGSQAQSGVTNVLECWYIPNPSTGSQNIVATFSAAVLGSITAQSWNNVNLTTPTSAANFVSSAAVTPSPGATLSPTADDLIKAALISFDSNSTADITMSAGALIGTPTRDAVYSASAAGSAEQVSGNTITYSLTNTSGYALGYYLLQGSGGGGGSAVQFVSFTG